MKVIVSILIVVFLLSINSCILQAKAKEAKSGSIKIQTLSRSNEKSYNPLVVQVSGKKWLGEAFTNIPLNASQERKLIKGINKLIKLADGIETHTDKYKVEEIELNIGVDANADAVLITMGSSEGIKVRLTRLNP